MDAMTEEQRKEKAREYDRQRNKDPRRAAMKLAYKRKAEYRQKENKLRRDHYADRKAFKRVCEVMQVAQAVQNVDAIKESEAFKIVAKITDERKRMQRVKQHESYLKNAEKRREYERNRYALNINGTKDKRREKDRTDPKRIAYKKELLIKYKQTEKYKEYMRQYAKRYALLRKTKP